MSGTKQWLFEHQEGAKSRGGWRDGRDGGAEAAEIRERWAIRLGGEVEGRDIICPGPKKKPDDRSLTVRVTGPADFFLYDFEGSWRDADEHVRSRLGLEAPAPKDHSEQIQKICGESLPAEGTHVESYLNSRRLTLPNIPEALRFHPHLRHRSGLSYPAMIGIVSDVNGVQRAIHRTFLNLNIGQGKAPVEPNKMTLGPISGCAIRLAPAADTLMIGEGIETCLSAMQETGLPAWSAISAGGLRTIDLPEIVREVIILADAGRCGETAAVFAASRQAAMGRKASIARPPPGSPDGYDFNDLLQAGCAQ